MSLERLSDPNEINIKEVSAEAKEKKTDELLFDPERDFSPEDIKEIRERLITLAQEDWEKIDQFLDLAFDSKFILPEALEKVNLEQARASLFKRAKHLKGSADRFYYSFMGQLKLISKGQYNRIAFILKFNKDELVKFFKPSTTPCKISGLDCPEAVLFLKNDTERNEDSFNWENSYDELNEALSNGNMFFVSNILSYIKISFPEKMPKITEEMWKKFQNEAEELREHKAYSSLVRFYKNMMILQAEKIEYTENGIELIMPNAGDFKQDIPEMPAERNY